jgi:hypothetical protein
LGFFATAKWQNAFRERKMCQPFKENIPLEKKFVNRRKRISVRFLKFGLLAGHNRRLFDKSTRYSSTDFVDNIGRRTSEAVLSVRRS